MTEKAEAILKEIKKVIVGKDDIICKVLITLLARGHILIEDIPGVGKTTLALAFSKALSLDYKRMQFTPDVMPSDVTGFSIYNKATGGFDYSPGAAMCNLFLADEINRASSKTQSALLEVMEERKITVDGITRAVPKPYTVIATQNPLGSAGTQPLPESQLDRFTVRLSMGYPDLQSEAALLRERSQNDPLSQVRAVISADELLDMQRRADSVYVYDTIYPYIARLAAQTRTHPLLALGASPRASIALIQTAKALAFLQGRDYLLPDDIKAVFFDVTEHRLILNAKARLSGVTARNILENILRQIDPPAGRGRKA